MNHSLSLSHARYLLAASLVAVAAAAGCGSPAAEFRLNHVYAAVQENQNNVSIETRQLQNVNDIMVAMFGTPDEPRVPELPDVDTTAVMDQRKLEMSAGPVKRDDVQSVSGLYREHCAHCHGVTGGGAGPTAEFLNPYPRDYRKGFFKFKSTPRTIPPTDEDLHRTLYEGIVGTSMPSFKLLARNERESLVHYVRYLSVRGEVERQLIYALVTDMDEGELLIDQSGDDPDQFAYVRSIATDVFQKWIDAEDQVTPVPPRPDIPMEESIAKGRELFHGTVANCVKCHGPTALGDGNKNDFDDWTKELNPVAATKEQMNEYLSLGALRPRNIRPRNLRMDEFRGGRRPIDLYWRIHNGITGSGMPAASMRPEGAPENDKRLTPDDLWHIIDYVRSLPYETLSRPKADMPMNWRERS